MRFRSVRRGTAVTGLAVLSALALTGSAQAATGDARPGDRPHHGKKCVIVKMHHDGSGDARGHGKHGRCHVGAGKVVLKGTVKDIDTKTVHGRELTVLDVAGKKVIAGKRTGGDDLSEITKGDSVTVKGIKFAERDVVAARSIVEN